MWGHTGNTRWSQSLYNGQGDFRPCPGPFSSFGPGLKMSLGNLTNPRRDAQTPVKWPQPPRSPWDAQQPASPNPAHPHHGARARHTCKQPNMPGTEQNKSMFAERKLRDLPEIRTERQSDGNQERRDKTVTIYQNQSKDISHGTEISSGNDTGNGGRDLPTSFFRCNRGK